MSLLSDISMARGYRVPSITTPLGRPAPPHERQLQPSSTTLLGYPFHLTLTSATIPASLAAHLDDHHPNLLRLASPRLHRLPSKLRTEHAASSPSQRFADVAARIRRVWAEDALRGVTPGRSSSSRTESGHGQRTRVLIFVNRGSRAEDLSEYLNEHEIPSMALAGGSSKRGRGSNRHLAGFLQKPGPYSSSSSSLPVELQESRAKAKAKMPNADDDKAPRVLITTSLLSRGLDFTPSVRHVFVVDPPRNMVDFLHRAGRAARSGRAGTVVVFGRIKGRGADANREMRRKVSALGTK